MSSRDALHQGNDPFAVPVPGEAPRRRGGRLAHAPRQPPVLGEGTKMLGDRLRVPRLHHEAVHPLGDNVVSKGGCGDDHGRAGACRAALTSL